MQIIYKISVNHKYVYITCKQDFYLVLNHYQKIYRPKGTYKFSIDDLNKINVESGIAIYDIEIKYDGVESDLILTQADLNILDGDTNAVNIIDFSPIQLMEKLDNIHSICIAI